MGLIRTLRRNLSPSEARLGVAAWLHRVSSAELALMEPNRVCLAEIARELSRLPMGVAREQGVQCLQKGADGDAG